MKQAVVFTALVLSGLGVLGQGGPVITVWVPGAYADAPGNHLQSAPFVAAGGESERYQEVFAASEFDEIPQGGYILGMTFRRRGTGAFWGYSSRFQVNLSTTAAAPDGLSSTFASNIGPNDEIVFGPGLLLWGQLGGDTRVITFERPFYYSPGDGNLLLDMRNFSGNDRFQDPWAKDAGDSVYVEGDSVSCVFSVDVNASFGFVESTGYIVGFQIEVVPEPGTSVLLATGLGSWLWLRARRKRW